MTSWAAFDRAASCADRPAFLISSNSGGSVLSRYSVLTAEPVAILSAQKADQPIELRVEGKSAQCFAKIRDAVDAALGLLGRADGVLPWPEADLPFTGGLIGYLSYEFGAAFERMPKRDVKFGPPALWMGLYTSAYVLDRWRGEAWRIRRTCPMAPEAAERAESALDQVLQSLANSSHAGPAVKAVEDWEDDWEPSLSPGEYASAVAKIQDYLRRGDVYQVNLTNRFRRRVDCLPANIFSELLNANPVGFAAFLSDADWAIMSSSPELLLDLRRDGWMETRPIKGTIRCEAGDADAADRLLASAKDRAEHLMIVDLERNDLGRVCWAGSVHVDPMMAVEPGAGLLHLVSAVRGRMREGLGPADALGAMFPGGSVTGAPKVRAMEVIAELEPVPRGVYTGAMGWITPEGEARFNLAIRTLAWRRGTLDLHVGGGIVIDSNPEAEAAECRLKGAAMARAVAGAIERAGQGVHFSRHQAV